jgi:hypothetical protein
MVGDDVAGAPEPEVRDLGQHPALLRDRVRQHHVERRQPVGGHDQHQVAVDRVDVADLAAVEQLEAGELGFEHRVSGELGHGTVGASSLLP